MISNEFLAALRDTRHRFRWTLFENGKVRGFIEDLPNIAFHPIAAVAYLRTGKPFEGENWTEAGAALNLCWMDAGDLSAAADNRLEVCRDGRYVEDESRADLRHALLSALQLMETQLTRTWSSGLRRLFRPSAPAATVAISD